MAQMSNDHLCALVLEHILDLPGETPVKLCRGAGLTRDIPVARDFLQKLGANGADGSRRVSIRRGRFLTKSLDT